MKKTWTRASANADQVVIPPACPVHRDRRGLPPSTILLPLVGGALHLGGGLELENAENAEFLTVGAGAVGPAQGQAKWYEIA